MEKVQPGYELFDKPEPTDRIGVLQYLERVARVCYKSEKLITEDSCVRFIDATKKRKHWSVLEHYIFVFSVTKEIFDDIAFSQYISPEDSDFINARNFIQYTYDANAEDRYKYLVSASATALNYLWECECFGSDSKHGIVRVCKYLQTVIPEIMMDPWNHDDIDINGVSLLLRKEIDNLPDGLRLVHDFVPVRFTCSRSVTHQIVRHRPASYAMESTRYVNYVTHDSVANFGMKFIHPTFLRGDKDKCSKIWEKWMPMFETAYNELIVAGAAPEEARSVLPQSIKAELHMTARLYEMKHFFDMRCDKHADPQIRQVAIPLCLDLNVKYSGLFDDQVNIITIEDIKRFGNRFGEIYANHE